MHFTLGAALVPCFLLGAAALATPPAQPQLLSRDTGSSNIAGAVLTKGSNTFYTNIASFTVPTHVQGGFGTTAAIYIGIDDFFTCSTRFVCGVLVIAKGDGTASYQAISSWGNAVNYLNTPTEAGDLLEVQLEVDSTGVAGSARIMNYRSNLLFNMGYDGDFGQLCLQNANWIVETSQNNNILFPQTIANLSSVVFENPTAGGPGGNFTAVDGAVDVSIEVNSVRQTLTTISEDAVTIQYL